MPVTLVLLVLAFGSLVATVAAGSWRALISMAMGSCALLSHYLHLSILVQNLATMLGLGLGIDYALLMVSRFAKRWPRDMIPDLLLISLPGKRGGR